MSDRLLVEGPTVSFPILGGDPLSGLRFGVILFIERV
jgi:hypothetical protein